MLICVRGLIFAVKLGPVPGFSGGSEYSVTPGWAVCLGVCLPKGVCLPRGVCQGGVCRGEGMCAQGGVYPGVCGRHPPVNRITDMCKNITLPQLRCGR